MSVSSVKNNVYINRNEEQDASVSIIPKYLQEKIWYWINQKGKPSLEDREYNDIAESLSKSEFSICKAINMLSNYNLTPALVSKFFGSRFGNGWEISKYVHQQLPSRLINNSSLRFLINRASRMADFEYAKIIFETSIYRMDQYILLAYIWVCRNFCKYDEIKKAISLVPPNIRMKADFCCAYFEIAVRLEEFQEAEMLYEPILH